MFGSTQHAIFPKSPVGLRLLILFIPSHVLSFISLFLSKPMGSTSMFLVPTAFLLTFIHHAAIWVLLARKPRTTVDVNSPSEARFECLYHLANICVEGLIAAFWLAGGLTSILVNVFKWKSSSPQDAAAASLAILEAGLMISINVYSWKLKKEARVYRMLRMTSSVSVVSSESAALIEREKVNV